MFIVGKKISFISSFFSANSISAAVEWYWCSKKKISDFDVANPSPAQLLSAILPDT